MKDYFIIRLLDIPLLSNQIKYQCQTVKAYSLNIMFNIGECETIVF